MAVPGAKVVVSDAIDICDTLRILYARTQDIYNRYWDTGLSDEVNALPNGTDKLAGTPIDKQTMLDALTVIGEFNNLMGGQAVFTNTYRILVNRVSALKE